MDIIENLTILLTSNYDNIIFLFLVQNLNYYMIFIPSLDKAIMEIWVNVSNHQINPLLCFMRES